METPSGTNGTVNTIIMKTITELVRITIVPVIVLILLLVLPSDIPIVGEIKALLGIHGSVFGPAAPSSSEIQAALYDWGGGKVNNSQVHKVNDVIGCSISDVRRRLNPAVDARAIASVDYSFKNINGGRTRYDNSWIGLWRRNGIWEITTTNAWPDC